MHMLTCEAHTLTCVLHLCPPTHPVRVHHTGMPDTSKRPKLEKVSFLRSSLVRACKVGGKIQVLSREGESQGNVVVCHALLQG